MRRKGAFDYILLETTGLADPGRFLFNLQEIDSIKVTCIQGPIASMFWHNEEYATGLADIVLDGVVCVVDAVFGKKVST
jgi:G3E family GTPase